MNQLLHSSPCIGVFDSGSGGLSVLAALRRRLPDAPMFYIGDVAHAPYGERERADVVARCQRLVQELVARGATLVVVACNTATVLAIAELRRAWPGIVFVGVEPGVKPAVAATRSGRIAVMATPATAASARLRHLVETFADGVHVHIVPCPGLAAAIERDVDDVDALDAVLATPCAAIRAARVDTVVLGCTHYPFAARAIQRRLGDGVALIDTAIAVAERVASVHVPAVHVSAVHAPSLHASAPLRVMSTGATAAMTMLLRRCGAVDRPTGAGADAAVALGVELEVEHLSI